MAGAALGARPSASAAPAAPGGNVSPAAALAQSAGEYVNTYAADCATPKTIFNLGDTVCAEAGAFSIALEPRYRRFQWVAPDGNVVDLTHIKIDPQSNTFAVPTSGDFAQVGTWYIRTVSWDSSVNVLAKFVVRSPYTSYSDLLIRHWGPSFVQQGDRVAYTLVVDNPGPDFAKGVEFTAEVPQNMLFLAIKQASGPWFDCKVPAQGGTGSITCLTRGLDLGQEATFVIYYQVNPDAKDGFQCLAAARVMSSTEELGKTDNEASYVSVVGDPNSGDSGSEVVEDP